ncbi:hypothetical protein [Pseudoduganella sp. GCM10020061]|uniref:hypothetical protein n=1 Tax=Pseudoduganella sp. GCM10020061 TaxID=3317345 RepID=UPI00362ADAFA
MTSARTTLAVAALSCCAIAVAAPPGLSASDQAAAFQGAGFKKSGSHWKKCDDPTPSYTPGEIAEVRDLNGDGRPEALITEGGTFCYGHTAAGYSVVTRQANGRWKLVTGGTGMVRFLATKGTGGWPDIEVGGPGFCFPVERWNGKAYVLHRHEYEGKRCTPSG